MPDPPNTSHDRYEVVWPDQAPAVFEGGALDGRTLDVPIRGGAAPLLVGVLLDEAGEVVEVRPGNELPPWSSSDTGPWLRYEMVDWVKAQPDRPFRYAPFGRRS
jgi:hypothetical protein